MEHQPGSSIELPKPVSSPNSLTPNEAPVRGAERAPAREVVSQNSGQPTYVPVTTAPQQASVATQKAGSTAAAKGPTQGNPAIADDADLIEKEWVAKAKQIVKKTKEDPYNQNKELNVFKADYMKKRYGKDIKLTNG